MNEKEFFELVVEVRKAQNAYFAARRRRGLVSERELRSLLFASKIVEAKLDHEIERVLEDRKEAIEPKLNFDSDV